MAEPDLSDVASPSYEWMDTVCAGAKELLPHRAPTPKGPYVTTITYVDANLYHDYISGKAVTGVLHLVNQTPVDWYTKKQSTVETATYSSEFVAAKTAVEQLLDLRTTLRYLGANVREKSHMFGDNQSVVTSLSVMCTRGCGPVSSRC